MERNNTLPYTATRNKNTCGKKQNFGGKETIKKTLFYYLEFFWNFTAVADIDFTQNASIDAK